MKELRRFSGLRLRFWHIIWRLMTSRVALAAKPVLKTLTLMAFFAALFAAFLTALVLSVDRKPIEEDSTSLFTSLNQSLKWQALIVAGFFLIFLLRWAYRRRKHLLIDAFKIHPARSGEEPVSGDALASSIQNALARLLTLFRHIDEASASGAGKIVKVTPVVIGDEAESVLLAGQVSPEIKIKLGKVEIPVGIALSALGRLFPAPRLTGCLHEDRDGKLILTGTLRDGGRCWNWRVTSADLEEPAADRGETARQMAEQLVYRMAADLLPTLGSPRWQAVRHYTEGLRQIRPTFHTREDEARHLRKAEQCFRRALAEDENFVPCHFNLGYVYTRMDTGSIPEAAVEAFRQALREKPGDVRSCYAVAQICYERERFDDAIWLSRNTLHIDPHHAAAHNLLGLAIWKRWDADQENPGNQEIERKFLALAQKHFAAGAAEAWLALCKARWADRNVRESEDVVRICELNLGITLGAQNRRRAAEAAFRRALQLRPNDHEICFERGKVAFKAKRWQRSYEAFDRVLKEGLDAEDVEDLWAYLITVHSHLYTAAGRNELVRQWHANEALDCFQLAADQAALSAARGEISRLADYHRRTLKLCEDEVEMCGVSYLSRLTSILAFLPKLYRMEARVLRAYLDLQEVVATAVLDRQGDKDDLVEGLRLLKNAENDAGLKIEEHRKHWLRAQVALRLASLQAEEFLGPRYDGVPSFEEVQQHFDAALAETGTRRLRAQFEQFLRLQRARVYLAESVRKKSDEGIRSSDLLTQALVEANRAVALKPNGFRERLLLSHIYLEIGDYDQAETELKVCSEREGLETEESVELIEMLGQVCVEHAAHTDPTAGNEILTRGLKDLQEARDRLESSPLIPPEAHAAVHHWLGVLESEIDHADAGVLHLKTALALGYAHS